MITLLWRVVVLIPLALLPSEEYIVRARSYGVLSTVSPWVHISPVLDQSYSRSKDLESRRILSMLIEHSNDYDYSGEWHVTRTNGKYSGGGTLHLWDNGRGEYRVGPRYRGDYLLTMNLTWSVYDRALILDYGSFNEVYAPGPPPRNGPWSINDLVIVKGLPVRRVPKTLVVPGSNRLRLYGLTTKW